MQTNIHDLTGSTNPFDDEFELSHLPVEGVEKVEGVEVIDPTQVASPPPPSPMPQLSDELFKPDPEKAARQQQMIENYVSQLFKEATKSTADEPVKEGVEDGRVVGVGPATLPNTPTTEIDDQTDLPPNFPTPESIAAALREAEKTSVESSVATGDFDPPAPSAPPETVVPTAPPVTVVFPEIDFEDDLEKAIRASMQTQIGPSIPNVINSCYIDSLLVAMFMVEAMDPVSNHATSSDVGTDLLIAIKTLIIGPLRNGEVVSEDTMKIFRQQLIMYGWQTDEEMYDQQDVKDLYEFLVEKMNFTLTEVRRTTFSSASPSARDFGKVEKMSYIPLNLSEDEYSLEEVRTSHLLHNWLNHNIAKAERKLDGKDTQLDVLNAYQFVDTCWPELIALAVNRFPSPSVRYKGRIKPSTLLLPFKHEKGDICNMAWDIQAIICHEPGPLPDPVPENYSPLKSGHYYCYYIDGEKMMRFNDLESPSLVEIDRSDLTERAEMERHLVFVIYRRRVL